MRLSPLATALAAGVLVLTSCGGDDEPEKKSTQPEGIDLPAHEGMPEGRKVQLKKMCDGLSDAEVSEVLGEDVTRGAPVRNNCTFTDLSDLHPSVTLIAMPLEDVGGVEGLEGALSDDDGEAPETVEDIGDQAFLRIDEEDDGSVATAAMAVRETYLHLQVTLAPDAGAEETEQAALDLLQLIDSRLPEARAGKND